MNPGTLRIPLWFKLLYAAFVAVLVPIYWHHYGPVNFLYFCGFALLVGLPGIWFENSLLVSAPAVGIIAPQIFWMLDFLAELFGFRLTGMTAYMFDPALPLYLRALSLYHVWLPFVLLWAVFRLGYDRRAWVACTAVTVPLLIVSYLLVPPPPAPDPRAIANLNYVYGFSDKGPQQLMPQWAWLGMMLVGLPLLVFWPTHWMLRKYIPRPTS